MTSDAAAIPGGVLALAADLRIVAANARLGSIVGGDASGLIGTPFEQLLSLPARILFQTHVYPALLADGRVEEVFLTLDVAGEPVPVLLNAERASGAKDIAFTALLVRIRARSRWEQDLLATTRELERERVASRQLADDLQAAARDLEARRADEVRTREFRDAFVGVISHELRTPITTIFGMSHLLRERHRTMEPDAVAARLEDIENESDRLRRLTEDLLVLSRAEGGKLEVAEDPLVIGHIIRAAVDGERRRAPGHRFEVSVAPDLPLVLGDATYVEQVLRNFLGNAVKYSPAGSMVRTTAIGAEGGVSVRVIDEGRGLDDVEPDLLWELFYRTRDAIRHTSGAGIGLFVSRQLIEAMGGRVWAMPATADRSGGAEFGFFLTASAEPEEE